MTRGKVGKCEGKGWIAAWGGGMTWGRQMGDGASPRFLAEPRNDSVIGVSAGMDEVGGRAWYSEWPDAFEKGTGDRVWSLSH